MRSPALRDDETQPKPLCIFKSRQGIKHLDPSAVALGAVGLYLD
jgi:hypothetical protein